VHKKINLPRSMYCINLWYVLIITGEL